MKYLAPIVLFVYNRPEHTRKTLEALSLNSLADKSTLYVFADGAKENASKSDREKIEEVRHLITTKKWCREIHLIESEYNKGLAESIKGGVSKIINEHGKVIVLEDDIVTSSGFLLYMNKALDIYMTHKNVWHISSFVPYKANFRPLPDTYFLHFMSCWGWATWADRWNKAIWDGREIKDFLYQKNLWKRFNLDNTFNAQEQLTNNLKGVLKSWAIFWYSTIFLNQGFCLYPYPSLSKNIGLDGSGENCAENFWDIELVQEVSVTRKKIVENKNAFRLLKKFYRYGEQISLARQLRIELGNLKHKVHKKLF